MDREVGVRRRRDPKLNNGKTVIPSLIRLKILEKISERRVVKGFEYTNIYRDGVQSIPSVPVSHLFGS